MAQNQPNIMNDSSYTFYFDTFARNKNCEGTTEANATNPADMDVVLTRYKAPFSQFYLASLELPKLGQYTVEEAWQTLYFSEGLQLRVAGTEAANNCIREFPVLHNGATLTAILPAYLNPIISVSNGGTSSPILEFSVEHGLESLAGGTCPVDDPVRLISTNVLYSESLGADFLVLDPFTVQLSLSAPVTWTSPFGQLYAPAISDPVSLACMVTSALNVVAPGEYSVKYNTVTGLFSFCVLHPNLGTVCYTSPIAPQCPPTRLDCFNPVNVNQDTVAILINGNRCLPYLMGFGHCGTQIPIPSQAPYCVTGQFGFCNCQSKAMIPPGNYDALGLGSALSTQLNRFYFPCGCPSAPTTQPSFVFADQCGVCYAIPIVCGLYTPVTFAAFLESKMNAADAGKNYVVTFSTTLGFCFSADPGNTFSLEFGVAAVADVAIRLGFPNLPMRNRTQYCSVYPLHVPIKDCCVGPLDSPPHYLSNIVEVSVSSSTQQYSLLPNTQAPIEATDVTCGGGGTTAVITSTQAHGLQLGDVVRITTPTGTFEFEVIVVTSAFIFTISMGSVDCAANLPDGDGTCFSQAELPILNLFFAPSPCQITPLRPELLGFLPQDVLFQSASPDSLVIKSNTLYQLDPPAYLLLVATYPNNVATNNSHKNAAGQTISTILAKIIIYPSFKLERIMPYSGFLQELGQITKIRLSLLNPDHTPYQLHNVNWSGSLVFLVPTGVAKMIAY